MTPNGFLIIGVSGSGKTTLGQARAQKLGWDFFNSLLLKSQKMYLLSMSYNCGRYG
jgi:shikimate kinase